MKLIPTILYTSKEYEEFAKVAQASGVNRYYKKIKDPRYYQVLIRLIREISSGTGSVTRGASSEMTLGKPGRRRATST